MDGMTPGRRLSASTWVVLILLLAVAAWAAVVVEYQLTRHVTFVTVAPALMFTSFIVLWPFLGGARVTASGIRQALACGECGAIALPAPGITFCIRCGAYPKRAPQRTGGGPLPTA